MTSFSFRARNKMGELITGEREANNREQVAASIIEDGLIPIEINEAKTSDSLKINISDLDIFKPKVKIYPK